MPHLKHRTKRLFAHVSTRKKSIDTGISAEFTDYRRRLTSVTKTLKTLEKNMQATREAWTTLSKHNREFTEALSSGLPQRGAVHTHATEVETRMHDLQRRLTIHTSSDTPQARLAGVPHAYVTIIESLEKEYKSVETAYTEVARYAKKVTTLEKKSAKKGKREDSLERNVTKLAAARQEYDGRLRDIVTRMKVVYEKHEAVFQCAHHAYWLMSHAYGSDVGDATAETRAETLAVHRQLLNVDVANTDVLLPIARVPRVELLGGAPATSTMTTTTAATATAGDGGVSIESVDTGVPVGTISGVTGAFSHPETVGNPIVFHPTTHVNIPDVPTTVPMAPHVVENKTQYTADVAPPRSNAVATGQPVAA